MKSFSNKDYTDINAKINVKCWKDPQFKKKLLQNPRGAIEDLGCTLPSHTKVRIVEAHDQEIVFQVYPAPHNADSLPESELKKIAAAGGGLSVSIC